MSDLTKEEVQTFLRTHKKRASRVLSVLAKKREFYQAITSPVGSQILDGIINKMEVILDNIINNPTSVTEQDRIKMEILRELSDEWANHVSAYLTETEKVRLNKI